MDNYLSYRWPEGDRPGWTPERLRPAPKKDRRLARNLIVAAVLLALVAALVVGGWLLVQRALQRMLAESVRRPHQDTGPSSSQAAPSHTAETSLPRARHGLGVTLELDTAAPRPLAADKVYDQVAPSVVSIVTRTPSGFGSGSGIVMREDGYILTNYHVIQGGVAVAVTPLDGGDDYPARLVGYDSELDVAVLKIEETGLPAARFGDSDLLRVGDPAYAIGNAMGYLYGTMTDGIISFLDREQTVDDTSMTLIQTTAVLNSGNSGGALVNQYGQVVGITVAKISGSAYDAPQVEGLGFAIPISAARPFIDRILDAGETWRPSMGIWCSQATVGGVTGIQVRDLNEGGPAMRAGFLPGDLIIAANGRAVTTLYALKRVQNDAGVGGTVTYTVLRDGERISLSLVLVDSADLSS